MSVRKKKRLLEQNAKQNGFCVYLGPTIKGVIQNGTVYRGTKEQVVKNLKLAIEKVPLISSLIVPGEKLPETRIKVKTPGNILYVNYKKILTENKTRR